MSNVDNTKKLQHLGLCTGYGGIERGIESTGQPLRTLAHVEIEAYAIANLVAKMEEGSMAPSPIWTDLKTLPLDPFRGVVDLLTGGYPCQPFSVAGKRLGKEDPRHLWPWICRIIDGVMPRMCFFENVEGHVNNGLRQVLADLEERGYKTAWGIFSAEQCGAPHQRKRVFIMAERNGCRSSRGWSGQGGVLEQQGILCGERERNPIRSEASRCGSASRELANSNREHRRSQTEERKLDSEIGYASQAWPSRPNQQQYEWEASRTIEPRLGGAVDGYPHKVDRLRLLGNGVVPQTAARAWITLSEELGQ